jgi:hypothetical protein
MTDSNQLSTILKKIRVSNSTFEGIFARDTLPKNINSFPTYLIVNTDLSSGQGEHWVSILYFSNDVVEFFDSFGFPPHVYNIPLVHCSLFNSKRLQSDNSTVCGQYCVYYLYYRLRGHTLASIISSFSINNFYWNDKQVAKFIRNHFNVSNKLSRCNGNQKCISRCKCLTMPRI